MSDRTEFHRLEMVRDSYRAASCGLIVNSALYLVLVFAASAMFGFRAVMLADIAAAGLAYLSYVMQVAWIHRIAAGDRHAYLMTQMMVAASILAGAIAGGWLTFDLLAR